MGVAWLSWAIGTSVEHEVTTLAWVNLFHGIPVCNVDTCWSA